MKFDFCYKPFKKIIPNMNTAINWKNFDAENIVAGQPKSREVLTDNGSKVTAWTIPLKYKYPDGRLADLMVDYPELSTTSGIKTKDMKTYRKIQLTGTLDITLEDNEQFYEKFVKPFNERMLSHIVNNYEAMNLHKGPPAKDKMQKYRGIVEDKYLATFFHPTDKETKIPIEGSNPRTVLALMNFDNMKSLFTDASKTPITDPDTGKKCSFDETVELLSNIGFSFRPRVLHNKIDVGVIFRASSSVRSAIVYNIVQGNDESYQDEVAEELQQKYGSSIMQVNSQLAQLRKNKHSVPPACASSPPSNDFTNEDAVVFSSDNKPRRFAKDDSNVSFSTTTSTTTTSDSNGYDKSEEDASNDTLASDDTPAAAPAFFVTPKKPGLKKK